ncbi:MAG TPA: hypothetical protein VFM06_01075 [Candidatus Limnocylindria bacterium]|nr:hypothetical protein [Candidatus Limnocylindria bacterium]
MRGNVWLVLLAIGLGATACGEGAGAPAAGPASPSPAASAAPTTTPAATPKLEMPSVLLDVRAGAEVSRPGTIPPAPGGAVTRGPETHAVDEAGLVWLFDQAKSRVAVYDRDGFVRAVAVPDVPRGAGGLLVTGGRLYFRLADDHGVGYRELELDATTGRVLRDVDLRAGAASIYPFERVALAWIPSTQKGVDDRLGHDAFGNEYLRHYFLQSRAGQCFFVVRRVTPFGDVVAEACFDVGSTARDYFVRRDGAVYQLEQLYTGASLDRFAVTQIMSPAR